MAADKNAQRKLCLESRRALTDEERELKSREICRKIGDLDVFRNAKTVFSYFASYDEADPQYLPKEGKVFCYPISYKGGIMEARIPAEKDGLEEGRFGIISPRTDNSVLADPADIDLVIVPCVGFDEKLGRLGHGRGYYDRYLPKCVNAKMICIAFEAQKLDNVVTDAFDVPMQYIVSEEAMYK